MIALSVTQPVVFPLMAEGVVAGVKVSVRRPSVQGQIYLYSKGREQDTRIQQCYTSSLYYKYEFQGQKMWTH